jgi:hypothetical protein
VPRVGLSICHRVAGDDPKSGVVSACCLVRFGIGRQVARAAAEFNQQRTSRDSAEGGRVQSRNDAQSCAPLWQMLA